MFSLLVGKDKVIKEVTQSGDEQIETPIDASEAWKLLKQQYKHLPLGVLIKALERDMYFKCAIGICSYFKIRESVLNVFFEVYPYELETRQVRVFRLAYKKGKAKDRIGSVTDFNSLIVQPLCQTDFYDLTSEKEKYREDVEDKVEESLKHYKIKKGDAVFIDNRKIRKFKIHTLSETINYIKKGRDIFLKNDLEYIMRINSNRQSQ